MRQRHILLLFLVALCVLTFLDRLCIAVAGPRMQAELGISPKQWGWVLGAFVLAYGLFEIPTGVMGDRGGRRKVLARIVLWWSAFTALTGAVSGVNILIAVRFLFGMGEAGAYPNMAGVVAAWFTVKQRAAAQGFIWGASRAGGAVSPLLVVPIQQAFGWRAAFWIFGACGAIWCAAWLWWYKDDPADNPRITPEELDAIRDLSRPGRHALPWRALFGNRQLLVILFMYGTYAWGPWFYFSWLHTYLVRARGFSEAEMAVGAALPFVLGSAANVAGGYLSDYAVRAMGMRRGRSWPGAACLAVSALLIVAAASSAGKVIAIALLAAGFGAMDLMLPSAWAICLDIGGRHAGAVTGAMNTAGQFGGFLCAVIFGYVVTWFRSYNAPLFLIAGMLLVSAALFLLIDATRPLFGDDAVAEKVS